MRRLAYRLGLRTWTAHLTRYGHPRHPWDPPSWDPDPTEFR